MPTPITLITGASSGIGLATALELSHRGHHIALVARPSDRLDRAASQLPNSKPFPADISDPEKAQSAVTSALNHFGRLDALVHCAGLAPVGSIEQTSIEQWRAVLDTNLSAAFYLAKAAWPIFKNQSAGVIVNLSSMACRDPFPGFSAYASAKAGLNLLGLSLAREGKEHNIRVHTIAPSAVETPMFRALASEQQWPASKTLQPAEVAQVIADCVTGQLRYTSGEVIFLSKTL